MNPEKLLTELRIEYARLLYSKGTKDEWIKLGDRFKSANLPSNAAMCYQHAKEAERAATTLAPQNGAEVER